ncbi:hypothetical protein Mal52_02180 [Symmachiella dynata]|uniref:Uncharacterized protein n=1 Tax=Symmachiella dynata TaxID=2527995 RepID=A0A517ZH14_9PLAN|nr:hypothetical protein Mal52_02180 [Symmachiella dynata]
MKPQLAGLIMFVAAIATTIAGCSPSPQPMDVVPADNHILSKPHYWKPNSALSALVSLQTEIVQQELNLNNQQQEQIRRLRQSFDRDARQLSETYVAEYLEGKHPPPLDAELTRLLEPSVHVQLSEILTTPQRERFVQIEAQGWDIFLFEDQEYTDYLAINDSQLKTINDIVERSFEQRHAYDKNYSESYQKAVGSKFVWADSPKIALAEIHNNEFGKKYSQAFDEAIEAHDELHRDEIIALEKIRDAGHRKVRLQTWDKILSVLNPQQRQQLDELWGKKVDFDQLLEQTEKTAINVRYDVPPGSKQVLSGNVYIR